MKKDRIIFWSTTGIVSAMMLFAAYSYVTNPVVKTGFTHLGFPSYFRIELAIAKALGAITLILPMLPRRLKDFAYAGFAITFVSAFIAHLSSGDAINVAVGPLVFLIILIISYVYFYKSISKII